MFSIRRIRERLSQTWTAYGCAQRPTTDLQRILGHATRSRATAFVVNAQLSFVMRHPRAAAPADHLARRLEPLGAPPDRPTTWLVHVRPSTGRIIVHEIDGRGRLTAVVKLGDADDQGLAHEARVLAALRDIECPPELVLPELLGFSSGPEGAAIRTRLALGRPFPVPYRWSDRLLIEIRSALDQLHRCLGRLPEDLLLPSSLREGDTPSHGDFTPWNLFLHGDRVAPRFAVIDYEEAAHRPAWWDARRLVDSAIAERRITRGRAARAAEILGLDRGSRVERAPG
jgi:hypothetical protein